MKYNIHFAQSGQQSQCTVLESTGQTKYDQQKKKNLAASFEWYVWVCVKESNFNEQNNVYEIRKLLKQPSGAKNNIREKCGSFMSFSGYHS